MMIWGLGAIQVDAFFLFFPSTYDKLTEAKTRLKRQIETHKKQKRNKMTEAKASIGLLLRSYALVMNGQEFGPRLLNPAPTHQPVINRETMLPR